ncbi:hypothetical protein DRW48_13270 [Paracoccus suum]|uniref:Uncharacterized protein n=1 Tax=Paracoccus suum TaxID=2259340 RepID=A0A344PMB4_9RHOB|nr:hypothetical protein DRW48_13270 [Paracoccus suum]
MERIITAPVGHDQAGDRVSSRITPTSIIALGAPVARWQSRSSAALRASTTWPRARIAPRDEFMVATERGNRLIYPPAR